MQSGYAPTIIVGAKAADMIRAGVSTRNVDRAAKPHCATTDVLRGQAPHRCREMSGYAPK